MTRLLNQNLKKCVMEPGRTKVVVKMAQSRRLSALYHTAENQTIPIWLAKVVLLKLCAHSSAHMQLLSIFLELNSDVPAHVAPQPYQALLKQTSSCMRATYNCPVTMRPRFYSLFSKDATLQKNPCRCLMPESLYESFQSREDALRGRPA